MGNVFPLRSKVTCKSLAHLEVKNSLKSHLGYIKLVSVGMMSLSVVRESANQN